MFRFLSDCEVFYTEVEAFLLDVFGPCSTLTSLLEYQRGVMITPDYDPRLGRDVSLHHDWPAYFDDRHLEAKELPEPVELANPINLRIERQQAGVHLDYPLDFHEPRDEDDDRPFLHRYLDAVIDIEYARLQRTFFKGVTVAEAGSLAAAS